MEGQDLNSNPNPYHTDTTNRANSLPVGSSWHFIKPVRPVYALLVCEVIAIIN